MEGFDPYDVAFSICLVIILIALYIAISRLIKFFKDLDTRLKKIEKATADNNSLDYN